MALPRQLKRYLSHQGKSYSYTLKTSRSGALARLQLRIVNTRTPASLLQIQEIQTTDLFPTQISELIEGALKQGWQPEVPGFDLYWSAPDLKILAQAEFLPTPETLSLEPVIELEIGEQLSLEQISDLQLLELFESMFADWLQDRQAVEQLLEHFAELTPGLSGGYCLLRDQQMILQPGCCCGLWSLTDWKAVLENDSGSIWTGHSAQKLVSFERGLKHVRINFSATEHVTFLLDQYQEMLVRTDQQLQSLGQRIIPILNQLFETDAGPKLAPLLIYKT